MPRRYRYSLNGEPAETDNPCLTVDEILSGFGLSGFRLKNLRTGTEYFNLDHPVFLLDGDELMTPNAPHHTYDVVAFRRMVQARAQSDKLPPE